MRTDNDLYFTPKFWPDKDNKEIPLDEKVDYNNPYEVLRHRQEVRLFYKNWVQVWRTYAYFSKRVIIITPIVYLLTSSLWATGISIAFSLASRIYFTRKLESILKFKMLATSLLDQFIIPHISPLEPFE